MTIEAAPSERAAALSYLRRDMMRNLPFLKMLATHDEAAQVRYRETDGRPAAVLLLPVAQSVFDRRTYPRAEWVVMLAADEPSDAVRLLLATIPGRYPLVFKIGARYLDALRQSLPVQRATAYVSYSWPADRPTAPDPRVRISLTADPLGKKLRAAMPTTLEDVLPFFDRGEARLFTIGEGDAVVAGCLTFPNFEHIHEIGVVYTAPGFRHCGYAQALVRTAAHDLRERGLTARYQADEDNAASHSVARAAGFVPFLTLEHWLSDRTA